MSQVFYDVSDSGGAASGDLSSKPRHEDELSSVERQLAGLADRLSARREEILRAWRGALERDTALTSGRQLTRVQLLDHVPQILDLLTEKLRADATSAQKPLQNVDEKEVQAAREHGIHRWQQGYNVWEVTREFGHLHLCLADEFELYSQSRADFSASAMHHAHRQLAMLASAGVEQSVEQFTHKREAEARSQVQNLEEILAQFNQMERERGQSLRAASHDLRGSLTVVEGTASLLRGTEDLPLRDDLSDLMKRGVDSLKRMMNDVLDLARLEAGAETLRLETFDVSVLMRDLCEALQPLAKPSGLTLEAVGESLLVEGDIVKTQRIAQNLLLNALKYTEEGGIRVEWEKLSDDEWTIRVLDSGSGVDSRQMTPIVHHFKEATQINREVEEPNPDQTPNIPTTLANAQNEISPALENRDSSAQTKRQADFQERLQPGEGIGLTIVKRLCDLLDARLEVESNAQGSIFSVVFPTLYNNRHA